ncbi:MAG TPA: 3'-5' exonuclease, partial [Thermoleophilia bacterium]|nr:3'-5' exonuclease [Thermoleophilia bacterium]
PRADDWREVFLEPGKLFVVGDPKQSIYRFRRADVAMYDEARRLVDGQPERTGQVEVIRQNFRTTPAITGWVNAVFGAVFDGDREEGRQPGYQGVEPFRPAAEGTRVAALLAAMRGAEAGRWRVQDRDAAAGSERWRAPRWGDVAVLFRATTGLETYEQALRAAGVPYRVDGGKTYFSRREVADALLCLRAVDDLSDGPALYGALHSTLFGFSDDDLFLFWAEGGRFDPYAVEQPAGHEAVAAALATLRDLHEQRAGLEPHEMVTELVRLTSAAEFLAASGPGAAQAIGNLEKLIDRARAFSGAGGGGLGAFLAWAAEADDTAGEQESQVDDDADVVHLLTIHKAKGLEYPIVVLIGGALPGGGGASEPIVDRPARRLRIKLKAALPGAAERALEPMAYAALREREKRMEASEMRRLLYVAATRARDHLVLSCFGRLTTQKGAPAGGVLLGPIHGSLPAPAAITEEYEDGELLVLPPATPAVRDEGDGSPDVAAMLAARGAWREQREALLRGAARPVRAAAPSSLEHIDEAVLSGGPGAPAGRARALALGSAVHRIMELCDLTDESSLGRVARAVALEIERPDLADAAAALAGVCWRSAPVRAAAAAQAADPDAVLRELSVGVLIEGAVVSGAIDLLYRDGDDWVIVDYKTDGDADAGVLRERYAPQGAAYAVAVEAATGGVVRDVVFVAAAAGGLVVAVPVDETLRDLALREVVAAVSDGRAIVPEGVSHV